MEAEMNALEYIASVIDSLAWPGAVVALVLILRTPVRDLLGDLTRVRYGDMEMNFGREVRELEDQARAAGLDLPEKTEKPKPGVQESTQIVAVAKRLASELPGPAVGLAWTAVEHELMLAVMRLAISEDYPLYNAALKNMDLLHEQGYIDADNRGVLERMRRLRNAAVHPRKAMVTVSADEAHEFIAVAEALVGKLRSLKR